VDLKPERSTEVEAGFDVGLLNDRVGLELNLLSQEDEGRHHLRDTPTTTGSRRGLPERGLGAQPGLRGRLEYPAGADAAISWDITLSGSTNNNKLLEKIVDGKPDTNPSSSTPQISAMPLVTRWAATGCDQSRINDINGDGIIDTNEVTLGPARCSSGLPANQRAGPQHGADPVP